MFLTAYCWLVYLQAEIQSLYAEECRLDDCIRFEKPGFLFSECLIYSVLQAVTCSLYREKQESLRFLDEDADYQKYSPFYLLF